MQLQQDPDLTLNGSRDELILKCSYFGKRIYTKKRISEIFLIFSTFKGQNSDDRSDEKIRIRIRSKPRKKTHPDADSKSSRIKPEPDEKIPRI